MDPIIIIRDLEMHVAHGCNLSCESCSHYSNQGHKGLISPKDAEAMISRWSKKISPKTFAIMGGEPTINRNLSEFFMVARHYWPNSRLKLITNGFFLDRHPDLPVIMQKIKNCTIELSIHHDAPEYLASIQPGIKLLQTWVKDYGIDAQLLNSVGRWTKRYYGQGNSFEPFSDNDIRKSWEICPAKYCVNLFEGKLWKCPPLAYLKLQKEKYSIADAWDPYLQYQPLNADCTFQELQEFLSREHESYCGMCPASPIPFKLSNPMRSVVSSINVAIS